MGQNYEGELSQMLDLQQRIASEIAVAAGRFPPPLARHGCRTQTIDPQAYDAYLKGLTAQGQQQHERVQPGGRHISRRPSPSSRISPKRMPSWR